MIIALHGPIGSGKTTVAEKLAFQYPSARRFSFATPLKEMMMVMLTEAGMHRDRAVEYIYGDRKAEPMDILQGKSARHAMQTLGTDWGRDKIGTNVWTDITFAAIDQYDDDTVCIIDDLRFPSELDRLRDLNAHCFKLVRKGVEYDTSHISEQSLDLPVIYNYDGDPELTATDIRKIIDGRHD